MRVAQFWRERGAVSLIMRTGTPTVERHALKFGCLKGITENTTPVKSRWIAPPAAFNRWLDKVFARDAAGVTAPGPVTVDTSQESGYIPDAHAKTTSPVDL